MTQPVVKVCVEAESVLLLVPTIPWSGCRRRLSPRHRGQLGQHRRSYEAVDAVGHQLHSHRPGGLRRINDVSQVLKLTSLIHLRINDVSLHTVRDAVLRAVRRQAVRSKEQILSRTLPALLRSLQRCRSHGVHLADGRPGNVPLRHHQVGHVMLQVPDEDVRYWFPCDFDPFSSFSHPNRRLRSHAWVRVGNCAMWVQQRGPGRPWPTQILVGWATMYLAPAIISVYVR